MALGGEEGVGALLGIATGAYDIAPLDELPILDGDETNGERDATALGIEPVQQDAHTPVQGK